MTESFRHEDASSERVQLEDGQVEVFFDGKADAKAISIVLETAEQHTVSANMPYGIIEYEELIVSDGSILKPADLSTRQRIAHFSDSLEPVMELGSSALLRTIEYRKEMKFLDIVRNDTTIAERKDIRRILLQEEQKRIPAVLVEQRDIFDEDEDLELWIRLDAANNPDKALVGKIIMARLAYFMSDDSRVGVAPMIYDAMNAMPNRIPEQLIINENWLYSELN